MGHELGAADADLLYSFNDIDAGLMANEDETLLRFADLVKNPEEHYPGGDIQFAVWYRKAVMDAHTMYRSESSQSTARTSQKVEVPLGRTENKAPTVSKRTVSDDKGTSDVKSEVQPPSNLHANGPVEKESIAQNDAVRFRTAVSSQASISTTSVRQMSGLMKLMASSRKLYKPIRATSVSNGDQGQVRDEPLAPSSLNTSTCLSDVSSQAASSSASSDETLRTTTDESNTVVVKVVSNLGPGRFGALPVQYASLQEYVRDQLDRAKPWEGAMLPPNRCATIGAVLAAEVQTNEWHRVKLVRRLVPGLDKIAVCSLETARTYEVSRDKLRFITDAVPVSAYAFPCQLTSVKPVGGEFWSGAAIETFNGMINGASTVLLKLSPNTELPSQRQRDSLDFVLRIQDLICDDESAAEQLVEAGLAERTSGTSLTEAHLMGVPRVF